MAMYMREAITAYDAGIGKTGLSLSDFRVNIYAIKKSDQTETHLVIDAPMTFEGSAGAYWYYMTNPDYLFYDYHIQIEYIGMEPLDFTLWDGYEVRGAGVGQEGGSTEYTFFVSDEITGKPVPNTPVWVSSDDEGQTIVDSGITDKDGKVTFQLNPSCTYYLRRARTMWKTTIQT
jgi:hypothetical protein